MQVMGERYKERIWRLLRYVRSEFLTAARILIFCVMDPDTILSGVWLQKGGGILLPLTSLHSVRGHNLNV